MSSALRLTVLNPGGRDPAQDFAEGSGEPGSGGHPPVNFHGYAACTRGSFCVSVAAALETGRPVLLLLRRDLKAGLRALRQLKAAGRLVAVTFKEAGATQLAARLVRPADLALLAEILTLADAGLAPTPWLAAFMAAVAPGRRTAFIPTPYPLEDPRWDFSSAERRGVFVGTREFDTPSRQHLAAVLAARELHRRTGEPATVLNADGRRGAKMLAALGFSVGGAGLRRVDGPLRYPAYLGEMARHKVVFQLDRSGVPGQVAGDALLCRIPCVGGDGAVEQLAFAPWTGRTPGELMEIAATLLTDPAAHAAACAESQTRARAMVGNETVAAQLNAFYNQ